MGESDPELEPPAQPASSRPDKAQAKAPVAVAPPKASAKAEPSPKSRVNSSAYKTECMRLSRKMASLNTEQYPNLSNLWNGNSQQRSQVLQEFLTHKEVLENMEAALEVTRLAATKLDKNRELLTLKEMVARNFSERLGAILAAI